MFPFFAFLTIPLVIFFVAFMANRDRLKNYPFPWQVRRLTDRLKADFGFEVAHSFSALNVRAEGTIDRCRVQVDFVSPSQEYFIRIRLKSEAALLPLLAIRHAGTLSENDGPSPGPSLEIGDLAAVNRSLRKEIFSLPIQEDLSLIRDRTDSFRIYGGEIGIHLPWAALDPGALAETVAAASRLASRLVEAGRNTDVLLHALLVKIDRSPALEELKECLLHLTARFPGHTLTERALDRLLDNPDLEIAALAAEKKGLGLVPFLNSSLHRFSLTDQVRAVNLIGLKKAPGGADYLTAFFPKAQTTNLRVAVINALKSFPDAEAGAVFMTSLGDQSDVVKAAAIAALAKRGGREALGPLYRLAEDTSLPPLLRGQAKDAVAAIMARHGVEGSGGLSLAGPGTDGGLSLAGDAPGGELSLTADKDRADRPSTEKLKH